MFGSRQAQPIKSGTNARGGRPALITRERILEVARQIPIGDLTMPAVALRLGVSTAALYRHFDSRDALLATLGSELSAGFKLVPANPENWREWLRETALALYDFLTANPVILAVPGWTHVVGMAQPMLEVAYETLEGAGFSVVEATEIWGLVSGNVYLRARLLHDAEVYGERDVLRAAGSSDGNLGKSNATRWRAYKEACGSTDPRELLIHSLRWLIATLSEPTARKTRAAQGRK